MTSNQKKDLSHNRKEKQENDYQLKLIQPKALKQGDNLANCIIQVKQLLNQSRQEKDIHQLAEQSSNNNSNSRLMLSNVRTTEPAVLQEDLSQRRNYSARPLNNTKFQHTASSNLKNLIYNSQKKVRELSFSSSYFHRSNQSQQDERNSDQISPARSSERLKLMMRNYKPVIRSLENTQKFKLKETPFTLTNQSLNLYSACKLINPSIQLNSPFNSARQSVNDYSQSQHLQNKPSQQFLRVESSQCLLRATDLTSKLEFANRKQSHQPQTQQLKVHLEKFNGKKQDVNETISSCDSADVQPTFEDDHQNTRITLMNQKAINHLQINHMLPHNKTKQNASKVQQFESASKVIGFIHQRTQDVKVGSYDSNKAPIVSYDLTKMTPKAGLKDEADNKGISDEMSSYSFAPSSNSGFQYSTKYYRPLSNMSNIKQNTINRPVMNQNYSYFPNGGGHEEDSTIENSQATGNNQQNQQQHNSNLNGYISFGQILKVGASTADKDKNQALKAFQKHDSLLESGSEVILFRADDSTINEELRTGGVSSFALRIEQKQSNQQSMQKHQSQGDMLLKQVVMINENITKQSQLKGLLQRATNSNNNTTIGKINTNYRF